MRMSYQMLASIVLTSFLAGCCTNSSCGNKPSSTCTASNFIYQRNVVATSKESYSAKRPAQVALYGANQIPLTPYKVIGVATVSKHNLLGSKREHTHINKMMKDLAASIGGDGVMNLSANNDNVRAQVIKFQRILI